MRCAEIMKTNVECALPRDTVESAAARMRDQNVGFLPVCDENKQVLGTLTDRDIATRVVAAGKPASTSVEEAMTAECVSCAPDDDLDQAQRLMAEHQKSRLMCMDDDGRLVGVISLSDVAEHATRGRASETLRQVSQREVKVQAEPAM